MFTKLRIQNFKGWKDTGYIRMAPITLFFGTNNSGKSSIGQFLMLLKQTVESQDQKMVLYPGGEFAAVQAASYQEMVFRRNPENNISFNYQWDLAEKLNFKNYLSKKLNLGDSLEFETKIDLIEKDQPFLVVDSLEYRLTDKANKLLVSVGMERSNEAISEYKLKVENYPLKKRQGHGWTLGSPTHFYGIPEEVLTSYRNADFIQELNLRHEKLLHSIFYLGPSRVKAERFYSWDGTVPESVGYSGENTLAAILAAQNRNISPGHRRHAKLLEEIIALELKEMGLLEEFKINPVSGKKNEYEIKVRIKWSEDWMNLYETGFGVSQVLPVLAQCFYAPCNSIIILEQPEAYLHPAAQSALADVMLDVINSKENGVDKKIQLIIESHSEYFLRRLQKRIVEGVVPKEKISAYFAKVSRAPASLEALQSDSFGNIQNWPEDFFGEEIGEWGQTGGIKE